MRRRFIVIALFLSLTLPAVANENPRGNPTLRDRAVKVMKLIAHLLEAGDMNWPHP
jgi:hypothetical protein